MFFPFLAAAIVAAAMVKLGALSVMVSVLSLALKVIVAVVIVFALVFLLGQISKTS